MPTQPLRNLPLGSSVFIDANVFIYAARSQSKECADLLQKCSREQNLGVTLLDVINDVTHRLMLAEAWTRGIIGKPAAHEIRKKATMISSLNEYWLKTEQILQMDLLFLVVNETLIRQAQVERQASGLLTNDSLIVACMRHYGVSFIASNDEDFGNVSGITLCKPDDI